jgi:ATP-binding cassette, subfamily C (CFTR/MRP), member 1
MQLIRHPLTHLQAAVDVETDAMLQTTLRSSIFKDRTIITIAHRINTILDSDRIVVLERGEVAEFDTPSTLIQRKGLFYDLVKEAGLLDLSGDGKSSISLAQSQVSR